MSDAPIITDILTYPILTNETSPHFAEALPLREVTMQEPDEFTSRYTWTVEGTTVRLGPDGRLGQILAGTSGLYLAQDENGELLQDGAGNGEYPFETAVELLCRAAVTDEAVLAAVIAEGLLLKPA